MSGVFYESRSRGWILIIVILILQFHLQYDTLITPNQKSLKKKKADYQAKYGATVARIEEMKKLV